MLDSIIEKIKTKEQIKNIIIYLVSALFLSVTAQISIPLPGGVPMTLQTFSIALMGFTLTENKSIKTILIYLFLGIIGIPVFASGNFGFIAVFGLTGGFLLGFIPFVLFCAKAKNAEKKTNKILLCAIALASLHILGILQYSILSGRGIIDSFVLVSLPFLLKDSLSILLALLISERLANLKYKNSHR